MKMRQLILSCLFASVLMIPAVAAENTVAPLSENAKADLFQCGSVSGTQSEARIRLFNHSSDHLYSLLYDGLNDMSEAIDVTEIGLSFDEVNLEILEIAYSSVVNDHPELFYVGAEYEVKGYSQDGNAYLTSVVPHYITFDEGLTEARADFEEAVNQALSHIDDSMDQVEKALVLHDYLAVNCAYNWDIATQSGMTVSDMVYTAYGALVDGDAVCQGYTMAYQYLLSRVGIDSTTVTSKRLSHIWNLVQIEDNWYHVDVTWDDPVPNREGGSNHDNFLRSDEAMLQNHNVNGYYDWLTGVAVDGIYESGSYVFNNCSYPFYYHDRNEASGFYYILDKGGNRADRFQLNWTDDLETAGTRVADLELDGYAALGAGVVWLDEDLYYTPYSTGTRILKQCSLITGETQEVKTYLFDQAASEDGAYSANYDDVGLRYVIGDGDVTVEAVSRTRPNTVLAQFVLAAYPAEWDLVSKEVKSIAGVTETKKGVLAGIVWPTASQEVHQAWAAFYDENGKMVGLKAQELTSSEAGLQLVEFDTEGVQAWRTVRVMLTDVNCFAPMCDSASCAVR